MESASNFQSAATEKPSKKASLKKKAKSDNITIEEDEPQPDVSTATASKPKPSKKASSKKVAKSDPITIEEDEPQPDVSIVTTSKLKASKKASSKKEPKSDPITIEEDEAEPDVPTATGQKLKPSKKVSSKKEFKSEPITIEEDEPEPDVSIASAPKLKKKKGKKPETEEKEETSDLDVQQAVEAPSKSKDDANKKKKKDRRGVNNHSDSDNEAALEHATRHQPVSSASEAVQEILQPSAVEEPSAAATKKKRARKPPEEKGEKESVVEDGDEGAPFAAPNAPAPRSGSRTASSDVSNQGKLSKKASSKKEAREPKSEPIKIEEDEPEPQPDKSTAKLNKTKGKKPLEPEENKETSDHDDQQAVEAPPKSKEHANKKKKGDRRRVVTQSDSDDEATPAPAPAPAAAASASAPAAGDKRKEKELASEEQPKQKPASSASEAVQVSNKFAFDDGAAEEDVGDGEGEGDEGRESPHPMNVTYTVKPKRGKQADKRAKKAEKAAAAAAEAASRASGKEATDSFVPMELGPEDRGLDNFSLAIATTTSSKGPAENQLDIKAENFSISGGGKNLFDNASLTITNGRKYGLVGPNGHGKTTLLRYIAARKLPIPANIDVLYCEQEIEAQDEKSAVQVVVESDKKRTELMAQSAKMTANIEKGTSIEASLEKLRLVDQELRSTKADAAEGRARKILAGLGFSKEMMESPTRSLSGGWRVRVSLARALFLEPTLLLLDEPTNHLDLNAVIWLDNYLQKWKKTLLIVSHDQSFLDNVCTDIIHLDEKKLYNYRGNYTKFRKMFAQKLSEHSKEFEKQQKRIKQLKSSGKSTKDAVAKELESMSKKQAKDAKGKTTKGLTSEAVEAAPVQLLQKKREYQVTFKFEQAGSHSGPVLGLRDVTFRYENPPRLIFEHIDFGVDLSTRAVIVGDNGSGKSTLLKLLYQRDDSMKPTKGEAVKDPRVKIGKFDQHSGEHFPLEVSATDYMMSRFNLQMQEARKQLGSFGLPGFAHTIPMQQLSGGQKSRVAFGELALEKPDIFILDEPTNNLDLESIEALIESINKFNGGVVVVSHDERLIRNTDCVLYEVDGRRHTVRKFEGDFDDYREYVLSTLGETVAERAATEGEDSDED